MFGPISCVLNCVFLVDVVVLIVVVVVVLIVVLQDQGNVSSIQWMPDLSTKETIVTCAASNKLGPQVKDSFVGPIKSL